MNRFNHESIHGQTDGHYQTYDLPGLQSIIREFITFLRVYLFKSERNWMSWQTSTLPRGLMPVLWFSSLFYAVDLCRYMRRHIFVDQSSNGFCCWQTFILIETIARRAQLLILQAKNQWRQGGSFLWKLGRKEARSMPYRAWLFLMGDRLLSFGISKGK